MPGLITQGLSNAGVGARLVLSQATVETPVRSVVATTGDRAQAVPYAHNSGLSTSPA